MASRCEKLLKSLKECGDSVNVSTGDIVGAQNYAGIENSSRLGANVDGKSKKLTSKADRILRSLRIVEADEDESNTADDDKVVAQVTQDVTVGDIKNASKAAKLLADAGKLDKTTAENINKLSQTLK